MTQVHVKLFAGLNGYRPGLSAGEAFAVNLPDGATVRHLSQELGFPETEVRLVFVNGRIRDQDHVLEDGDEVGLFPPVGGG